MACRYEPEKWEYPFGDYLKQKQQTTGLKVIISNIHEEMTIQS